MGSNSSQWPPYPSYMDCSQKLCSIYCPQWCYIFPPPPQFDLSNDDDHSSSLANEFSPLIIAVIGVLATAFLLITYLTFMSKHCRNNRGLDRNSVSPEFDDPNQMSFNSLHQRASSGLDEAVIKSIAVCKYKKGDGFVDGTECSVCLGEFQDDENLRLLPKCSHAFHISCIDTWLQSHASCPLCRCSIPSVVVSPLPEPTNAGPPETTNSSAQPRHARHDTVLEVHELEEIARREAQIMNTENQCVVQLLQPQAIRRSVSLGSWSCQDRLSIQNGHCKGHEDHQDEASAENASRPYPANAKEISSQNPGVLTRSVSTGRAVLFKCKHGQGDKDSSAAPS
ncbi:hypothetical protein QQ045_032123 [Rhodiola kirilowii]